MLNLILDSSTKLLYICLVNDKKVLFEKYIPGFNDHAKHIVKTIEDGLKENKLKALDINNIYCGIGPGSYTGVRMAVTVAKIFATFSNISLYQISTLALMSSGYDKRVLARIDARRGNAFAAIYFNMEPITKEALVSLDSITDGYEEIASEDNFKVNPFKVMEHASLVVDYYSLIPNYLRDTEAERNLRND